MRMECEIICYSFHLPNPGFMERRVIMNEIFVIVTIIIVMLVMMTAMAMTIMAVKNVVLIRYYYCND